MIELANAPYSEGPLNCRICFVGEAPGETELMMRRPFVGSAGKKLDELLSSAGIVRSACRIENVFQFRPINNDASLFVDPNKRRESAEFILAKEQLLQRLSLCSANVIVPLGNIPLYTLTVLANITKRRGSILETPNGRKIIPTIHPSAALRQYLYEHYILHDLALILKESAFPEVKYLDRHLILSPTFQEALDYIRDCYNYKCIACDIEVRGDEVSHISLAKSAIDAICIPFIEGSNDYFTPEQEAIIWRELAKLLEAEKPRKLGQNLAFDATFLHSRLGICMHSIDDTMVAQGVIFPDFPKGLDFLTASYCEGEPYYKDEGKRWRKNPFGSEEKFRRYSAMDSAVPQQIFPSQVTDMFRLGNQNTYREQVAIIEPLVFMQEHGILVDIAGKNNASLDCTQKIKEKKEGLNKLCEREINPNSHKQLKDYFYITKGLKPYTKEGSSTTDESALKRIAARGYKEASLVLEIRHLVKMKGTYYDMVIDEDNRLRCSFNPVGTVSGRISSSKTIFGTGGNMLNLPDEMKKFLIADPGYIMISIDLSQAENRVVAYIANELRMIEAFEKGIDIHKETASLIFGIPYNQVSDEPGSCDLGGGLFSQRYWGKKANHALNYDLGPGQFALTYETSQSEAKFIIERYHSAYPGVRQWHAVVREKLRRDHRLTDCFGNTRIFMDRWGDDMFKSAYSYIPQSTVARKLNRDGLVYAYKQYAGTPLCLLNQVYDSLVMEFPLDDIAGISSAVWDIKCNLETPIEFHGRSFSIPVDTKIGFNLKDMKEIKSKDFQKPEDLEAQLENFLLEAGNEPKA